MRFVILTSGYPQFLDWLYRDAVPGLARRSFAEQREAYYQTLFATADFYVHALRALGHQVEEFIYNCDPMQLAWRRENLADGSGLEGEARPGGKPSGGASRRSAKQSVLEFVHRLKLASAGSWMRPWLAALGRPLLRRVHEATGYGFPLLVEQVRRSRPDVLFIQSLYAFDNEQLRELKQHAGFLVGEQAVMPIAEGIDYRHYDLVVSSFPPIVNWMRSHGVRSDLNRLAFDPRVHAQIPPAPADVPVSFVGSIFPMHRSRLRLLEEVAVEISELSVHGNVTVKLDRDSPLQDRLRPPLWGRDMYRLLRRSKITLNHHGDVLPFANNMRLYEATGMGCLLVTDYKDNLEEMFEPEKEVVTYRDSEECIDKLRFYLDDRHESKRKAIAATGHRRTLREHTYDARMRRLVSLIENRPVS